MLAGAARRGKRSWFLCHRKELVEQSVETFVVAADLHVGIVAAGYPSDLSAPVQVCSVASLARRMDHMPAPDLVVWDECQHLASASWAAIAHALPSAVHVGLTATPSRLDGKGLRPYFDELLLGPTTADLIAQGYLSPYQLYAPAMLDVSALHTVAGDYSKRDVADTMTATTVVGDAVSTYQRHAAGRALAFAWSLEASRGLATAFTDAGIPAGHVDGETPDSERRAAMQAFRRGDLRVLCNVELFGEGLDVPALDAVFLLRPTSSLSLYLQQVGRGLRTAEGKTSVAIFDHVGNWNRHGLPDDVRAWTLDGAGAKPKRDVQYGKRCAQCFAVASMATKACPQCRTPYPVQSRTVTRVEGELETLDLDKARLQAHLHQRERECCTLDDWQALAREMGYRPGWAFFRWSHRQGIMRKRASA